MWIANVVISVAGRSLDSVANDLVAIDEVGSVTLLMGDPAIMVLAMARSFLHFLERQMTEHPELVEPMDEAELAQIAALVEGVEPD